MILPLTIPPKGLAMFKKIPVAILFMVSCCALAQTQFSDDTRKYISVDSPVVALTHVRIIDGTGAAPAEDQTILIANGRIQKIGKSADITVPPGARVLEKRGYTVIPGLVGMHNHLYYTASLNRDEHGGTPAPGYFVNMVPYTGPRLYLACGVTSMRTAGSLEPYTDINVKKNIDTGRMPGPKT